MSRHVGYVVLCDRGHDMGGRHEGYGILDRVYDTIEEAAEAGRGALGDAHFSVHPVGQAVTLWEAWCDLYGTDPTNRDSDLELVMRAANILGSSVLHEAGPLAKSLRRIAMVTWPDEFWASGYGTDYASDGSVIDYDEHRGFHRLAPEIEEDDE